MRVLGFQGMTSRHFNKALPDYKPGVSITIDKSKFARQTKQTLDRILEDESALKKPSVYTGSAGIAYAICHILRNPNTSAHIQNATTLAKQAVDISKTALQQHRHHPSGVPWSLCFGESGAHLVAAFAHQIAANCGVTPTADLHAAAARHIESFIHYGDIAKTAACHEDEFLYGRAGYLMGALLLNNYFSEGAALETIGGAQSTSPAAVVPSTLIEAVARVLLSSGKHQAVAILPPSDPEYNTPLWWEWHSSPYLGAAHGSMGILYVLLQVPSPLLDAIPHSRELIREAVEYIMTLECDEMGIRGVQKGHFPSRMGPVRDKEPLLHWCHGAPGAVFLFTQAEKILNSSDGRGKSRGKDARRYLAVAERAGEAIWRHGLLKKGPGACHGISGNAFALLKLYKETNDEKWLHRAVQFAEFMESEEFLEGAREPDHKYSLYEGAAAAACLYADLIEPKSACFPLFDLLRERAIEE